MKNDQLLIELVTRELHVSDRVIGLPAPLSPAPWDGVNGSPFPPDLNIDYPDGEQVPSSTPNAVAFRASQAGYFKLANLTVQRGQYWGVSMAEVGDHGPWSNPDWIQEVEVEIRWLKSDRLPFPGTEAQPTDSRLTGRVDGTLTGNVEPGETFTIQAYIPRPDHNDLLQTPDVRVPINTGLPYRVKDLAEHVTLGTTHAADQLERVIHWLSTECEYKQPAPQSNVPVENFLFGSKQGTCQHFASAAVFLLRSLGIPSRVVGGYFSMRREFTGSGAHAWFEVFFEGIGWVTFDATPQQDRPQDGDPSEDEDPTDDYLDSMQPVDLEGFVPPPIPVPPRPRWDVFDDVEDWCRLFANKVKRIREEQTRPRDRGNYETGRRPNPSQLYRMKVGDNRILFRRKPAVKNPVEILMAIDESISVDDFRGAMDECWKRSRFAVSHGLDKSGIDFGLMGFAHSTKWYKHLNQPFSDSMRDKFVKAGTDFATNTAGAVEALRREHKKHDPNVKRYALVLTDGEPNSAYRADPPPHMDEAQWAVREQVDLAQAEGLTVIGLVLPHARRKKGIIDANTGIFDRLLVLSDKPDEVMEQLMTTLLRLITQ